MFFVAKSQIGKAGITEGYLESLRNTFKTHKRIRISALKASGRDKESITKMAEEIKARISIPCGYKIIGFTIILFRR